LELQPTGPPILVLFSPSASRRGVFELVAPRAAVLQPGDLIVVRTPGTFYRVFRSAANHKVDHLAIVVEKGMFLHVGPPTIRLLPVELLLTPNRRPLVFRPKLTQDELDSLLRSLKTLVGQQYDTVRVYSFVARLALSSYFGARFPLAAPRLKSLLPGMAAKGSKDLVYAGDTTGKGPLVSGVWLPKGDGTTLSPEAQSVAAAARARSMQNSRIATIGGRYAEEVDDTRFTQRPALVDDISGPPSDVPEVPGPTEAVICTDAILPRLLNASAEWRAALGIGANAGSGNGATAASSPLSRGAAALRKRLDYFQLRSWSINDVFSFNALRPDLLTRIRLPPVKLPEEFKDLEDTEEEQDATKNSAGRGVPTGVPLFQTVPWRALDSYLKKNHPALQAQSAAMETLMNQVYVSASPLFRSVVQLYSYTMKRLPVQVQTAVRLYMLLVVLRQLLQLWRGYVLVRSGVRIVRGALVKPTRQLLFGTEAATQKPVKRSLLKRLTSRSRSRSSSRDRRRSSRSHSRGKTTTPAIPLPSATQLKSLSSTVASVASKASSAEQLQQAADLAAQVIKQAVKQDTLEPINQAAKAAALKAIAAASSSASSSSTKCSSSRSPSPLSRALAHPRAQQLGELVVDTLLPSNGATARELMKEMIGEVVGGASSSGDAAERAREVEKKLPAASDASRAGLKQLLRPLAGAVASASSDASSSTTKGRKRAVLKSLAQNAATVAFPRLSRLVRFTQEELAAANANASGASSSLPASSARASSPSPSPSRSLSPALRAAQFAASHPHLASLFEQGKLLLLSAVVTHVGDQVIRSML
jgi:hypothetical protein